MKITVDMVMAEKPCSRYPRERVEELWGRQKWLTPTLVRWLGIPAADRAWLLGRLLDKRDNTRRVARMIIATEARGVDVPDAYARWLRSGDWRLRDAAWQAACVELDKNFSRLWVAASIASGVSHYDTTVDTAHNVAQYYGEDTQQPEVFRDIAMDKYAGWMAVVLEKIEEGVNQ